MEQEELERLWRDRLHDMSIKDIAGKYNLTEREVLECLKKAPKEFAHRYNTSHGIGLTSLYRQV